MSQQHASRTASKAGFRAGGCPSAGAGSLPGIWQTLPLTRRRYVTGDAPSIVALFGRAYRGYGGLVVRSVDYWKWAVPGRPGVTADDIVIVQYRDRLVAYGALDAQGAVLEMAVEPGLVRWHRRKALLFLMQGLEQRARARGCDALDCDVPASDTFVTRILHGLGFHSDVGGCMSIGIREPQAVIQRILEQRHEELGTQAQSWILALTPGYYRNLPPMRLHVSTGQRVRVEDCSTRPDVTAACTLQIDLTRLTDVIFRQVSPRTLLEAGELRVDSPLAERQALRLLDALRLKGPWHMVRSDAI